MVKMTVSGNQVCNPDGIFGNTAHRGERRKIAGAFRNRAAFEVDDSNLDIFDDLCVSFCTYQWVNTLC